MGGSEPLDRLLQLSDGPGVGLPPFSADAGQPAGLMETPGRSAEERLGSLQVMACGTERLLGAGQVATPVRGPGGDDRVLGLQLGLQPGMQADAATVFSNLVAGVIPPIIPAAQVVEDE